MAYENGQISLHARIKVRVFKKDDAGVERSGIIETTLGRLIFNRPIRRIWASSTVRRRKTFSSTN